MTVPAAACVVAAALVAVADLWSDPPRPDVTVGAAADGECPERMAEDGVVGSGTLRGGERWEFRVAQEDGWLNGWVYVDGGRSGGWGHDSASWPSVVNAGMLDANLVPVDGGWIVALLIPTTSARVVVELGDGRELVLCPASVPSTAVVGFAAGFVPYGPDIRALHVYDAVDRRIAWADDVPSADVAQAELDEHLASLPAGLDVPDGYSERGVMGFLLEIDPDLVDLPLGGTPVPDYVDPMANAVEVAAGELPGGRWSVRVGSNGREVAIELSRPDGTSPSVIGTSEQIRRDRSWNVELVGGRFVVWGLAPTDVATVAVSLADGTVVSAETSTPDLPGLDLAGFGVALPEGAVITAIEGLDASGAARHQADLSGLEDLASYPEPASASVLVEPVG